MKLVIKDPKMDMKGIDRAVNDMVDNSHRDDFVEIGGWMVKEGLGEEGAREKLINSILACISEEISKGIVQVTVQELERTTEIQTNIEKDLPNFYSHLDFVVKSGALDVWTTTYWFKVSSRVNLKDLVISLKNDEITGIQAGTLQAFMTLGYCGHNKGNPKPFNLIEDKMVIDQELNTIVKFE